MRLYDYDTGRELGGTPSAELVRESEQAAPTGAVYALFDRVSGVWDYLPAHQIPPRTDGNETWKISRVYVMP